MIKTVVYGHMNHNYGIQLISATVNTNYDTMGYAQPSWILEEDEKRKQIMTRFQQAATLEEAQHQAKLRQITAQSKAEALLVRAQASADSLALLTTAISNEAERSQIAKELALTYMNSFIAPGHDAETRQLTAALVQQKADLDDVAATQEQSVNTHQTGNSAVLNALLSNQTTHTQRQSTQATTTAQSPLDTTAGSPSMTIPELDPDFWTPDEHKVTPK
jgi:hypothetical protein